MKKALFILALVSFVFMPANAKTVTGKRYRGMAGYSIAGTGIGNGMDSYSTGFYTSHGFQINSHIYVGAGMGLQYNSSFDEVALPIFSNFRADILKTRITPFFDAKIGYSPANVKGLFCSPSIGVRFGLNQTVGINLSIGYVLQCHQELPNSQSIEFKAGIDF